MILVARNLAKTLVISRLPEFVQPAVARADRLLSRLKKVKILTSTPRVAMARPTPAVLQATPCGRGRIPQQLPRSKTREG